MSVHFNSEIRENKGQNIIAGINKVGIGEKKLKKWKVTKAKTPEKSGENSRKENWLTNHVFDEE